MGRQFGAGSIRLSGGHGNNISTLSGAGDVYSDYLYTIYPNGSTGQMYVHRGSVVENSSVSINAALPAENEGDPLVTLKHSKVSAETISASTTKTDIYTGYTTGALELGVGKVLESSLGGTFSASATACELQFTVVMGSTTVLTSNARSIPNTNTWNFNAEVKIIGVTTTTQKIAIICHAEDSAGNEITWVEYATSSVEARVAKTVTVTGQFSTNNGTLSRDYGYTKLL